MTTRTVDDADNIAVNDTMMPGESRGTVLYDGACGVCSRWVTLLGPMLGRHGFDIAPLQSPGMAEKLGMSEDELLHDIRLVTPSGESVQAADVYRYVMRRIWWTWPMYAVSRVPVLSWVFDRAYRTLARNRHAFSRTCGLHPPKH